MFVQHTGRRPSSSARLLLRGAVRGGEGSGGDSGCLRVLVDLLLSGRSGGGGLQRGKHTALDDRLRLHLLLLTELAQLFFLLLLQHPLFVLRECAFMDLLADFLEVLFMLCLALLFLTALHLLPLHQLPLPLAMQHHAVLLAFLCPRKQLRRPLLALLLLPPSLLLFHDTFFNLLLFKALQTLLLAPPPLFRSPLVLRIPQLAAELHFTLLLVLHHLLCLEALLLHCPAELQASCEVVALLLHLLQPLGGLGYPCLKPLDEGFAVCVFRPHVLEELQRAGFCSPCCDLLLQLLLHLQVPVVDFLKLLQHVLVPLLRDRRRGKAGSQNSPTTAGRRGGRRRGGMMAFFPLHTAAFSAVPPLLTPLNVGGFGWPTSVLFPITIVCGYIPPLVRFFFHRPFLYHLVFFHPHLFFRLLRPFPLPLFPSLLHRVLLGWSLLLLHSMHCLLFAHFLLHSPRHL
eukprot:Sspe_Gene.67081::Locus_39605_Transcript_1_1_Confidence_1.000_Length_1742::g.67081::m.67081